MSIRRTTEKWLPKTEFITKEVSKFKVKPVKQASIAPALIEKITCLESKLSSHM